MTLSEHFMSFHSQNGALGSPVVFGRNITLRYDTGIIRVFYTYASFNITPPILRPQFYDPPKYDPKPGQ